MATSVTRHGITWYFSADRTVGQFANGDYWVIGPVNIIDISPRSTIDGTGRTLHGTMVNPGPWGNQGYDSSMAFNFYWAADNKGRPNNAEISSGNPLVAVAGESVCSCRSHATPGQWPQLLDFAVLTVVSSAPAAGSFRPPYCGTDKSQTWKESDLNYGILPSLAPPTSDFGTPDLAAMEALYARTHNLHGGNLVLGQPTASGARMAAAINNQSSYGASRAMNLNLAGLSLCLNYSNTQKRNLFVYLVQHGIDIYGNINAGGSWADDGGLNQGIKAAMVFAARALNSTTIRNLCPGSLLKFHEDRQTWVVNSSDVGRVMQSPRQTYTSDMIGTPEWGEKHTLTPSRDNSNWGASYRSQNFEGVLGSALFIRLTGGRTWWDWQVYFDYAKRIWDNYRATIPVVGNRTSFSDSGNLGIQDFTWSMWNEYDYLGDYDGGVIPPPSNQVAQPTVTLVASPTARVFLGTAQVTMAVSNPLSGVTIRYTTDGSDPTPSSPAYSSPFTISADTQIRARGYATDWDPSEVRTVNFTKGYYTSPNGAWVSVLAGSHTGAAIPASCRAVPSFNALDAVIGIGVEADAFIDLACPVRFNTSGFVDAYNGLTSSYAAVNSFPYVAGTLYRIDWTINHAADPKTYTATITNLESGGSAVVIAQDYRFRSSQANIAALTHFSSYSSGGTLNLSEIVVGVPPTPPDPIAPAPEFAPAGGAFLGSIPLTMTTPLPGAEIRYTTNGTNPTASSTLYTGPLVISVNTTVKALTIKSGYQNSPINSADITINGLVSPYAEFESLYLGERQTDIEIEFDATPSASLIDSVIGISTAIPVAYSGLAVAVRFATTGFIQAYSGTGYGSDVSVPYTGGTSYHFKLQINRATKKFNVIVTPNAGSPTTLATNYDYRAGQVGANTLAYLSGQVGTASQTTTVENVTVAVVNYTPPLRGRISRRLLGSISTRR